MKKQMMLILGIMQASGCGPLQAMEDQIQDQRELLNAIYEGDEEKTIAAIEAGANVNKCYPSKSAFLEIAAQRGQNDIVKVLLNAGASDTSKALIVAAHNAYGAKVKTLLEAYASETNQTSGGFSKSRYP